MSFVQPRPAGQGGCDHAPQRNDRGDIISPRKEYGITDQPRFFCVKCKHVISEKAARQALSIPEDEPM